MEISPPRGLPARRIKRPIERVAEWLIVVLILLVFNSLLGVFNFRTFHPPRGITSLDQLVADLPETEKFAIVTQANQSFVVWIGRPRGPVVSGPPVYVFDQKGSLVDHVDDAGDSGNIFVGELYEEGFRRAGITTQEAVAYCNRH